jgi:hypothetical protein
VRLKIVVVLLLSMSPLVHAQGGGDLAFLQSFLVPGWGQYSLGAKRSAATFFTAELLMLGGILSTRSYGVSTRDDYEALAAAHAGVVGEHGHDFYVDVGNWMSVHEFNQQRLSDREFDRLYSSENDYWAWDSEGNRDRMERLRVNSDQALNSTYYFVGGIILNHLASAVHAGRTLAKMRKTRRESEFGANSIDYDLQPLTGYEHIGLKFNVHF